MLDIYKYGCLCNVARAASAGFAIAHQIRGRGSLALALSWGGFQHSGNNPRWCFKNAPSDDLCPPSFRRSSRRQAAASLDLTESYISGSAQAKWLTVWLAKGHEIRKVI
jgi:hypothetical protein